MDIYIQDTISHTPNPYLYPYKTITLAICYNFGKNTKKELLMEIKVAKETGGRPAFKPTDEQEKVCSLGVGFGLTHEQIGRLVGCSPKTLRKHFQHALETGRERLTMDIGSQLYKKAMNGDVISAIFLAKTKGGFQEKIEHEGLPNQISVSFNLDPPKEEKVIEGELATKRIE